jgi:hypothetical protein
LYITNQSTILAGARKHELLVVSGGLEFEEPWI